MRVKKLFSLKVFHAHVYCHAVTFIVETRLIIQANAFSFVSVIHKYLPI